jgi:hypothetical protein
LEAPESDIERLGVLFWEARRDEIDQDMVVRPFGITHIKSVGQKDVLCNLVEGQTGQLEVLQNI